MNIISGRISAHSDCQNLDVFVDWHCDSGEWSAEQQAYAYLPSGFRIDFYLAQLGVGFEDPRVSDTSQMKAAMADIAGSLHSAIFE